MPVLSAGIKIAQVAYRYGKTLGKFTSGETAFVGRFPPRYRDTVRTIIKGASTVTYGGLIADILKDNMGLTDTGIDGVQTGLQQPKSNKYDKTRNRYRGRSYKRKSNGYNRKRCSCAKCRFQSNRSRRRF